MANENLTPEQQKAAWNRGLNVLETLLTIYPVERLEAMSIYLSNKDNRKGLGYNSLMNSLKKIESENNLKPV